MAKNTRSVNRARGGSSRTPTIAAIVAVVIIAVVVFGGIFLFRGGGASSEPIAASPVQASYTTSVQDGGTIVAGRGPRTVEIWEDALCPACQQFEVVDGEKITDALNSGKVTVRYHMVNLLDSRSNPPGYSTLGGNALICAAENNAFPALHKTLYDRQPQENGTGYTAEQLAALGPAIGAGPGYQSCVQNGTYSAAVARNFEQAQADPRLQQAGGGFGTPTVLVDGRVVEPGSPELESALA